ncbi:MAG: hypothetical protein AAFP82_10650, partial [Bacteroidota bacterium]
MKAKAHTYHTIREKQKDNCLIHSSRIFVASCLYLWFFFSTLSLSIHGQSPNEDITKSVFFDCSHHDFSEGQPIALDGKWNFYWNELLSPQEIASGRYTATQVMVPQDWSMEQDSLLSYPTYGYATYQTRVKISKEVPRLSLSTTFLPTSSTIFINVKYLGRFAFSYFPIFEY